MSSPVDDPGPAYALRSHLFMPSGPATKDTRRRLSRRALPWCVVGLFAFSACTHYFTPYYRDQVHLVAAVEDTAIDHRLLLVGDAGDPNPAGEPTLQLLTSRVNLLPDRTTVVFLGDNIYERGMPDPIMRNEVGADTVKDIADEVLPGVFASRQQAERDINAQIDVVRGTTARAIFIPGNHDWDQFGDQGWRRVLNQEEYLRNAAADDTNVMMLPPGGCPGPVDVALGHRGELIALDTEWWLESRHDGKPTPDNNPTHCPYTVEEAVRLAIEAELEAAAEAHRWVVVAAHHPLASEGPHGGFVDIRTHLFPLLITGNYLPFYIKWVPIPVLGSIVVGLRKCCSPSAEDMSNRHNRHMRNSILEPMIKAARHNAAPLVYAAGHDHSLQIFEGRQGPRFELVSGLGSSVKASAVTSDRRTLFAHSNPADPGFVQMDFLKNGAVRLAVIEYNAQEPNGTEVYSLFLAHPKVKR